MILWEEKKHHIIKIFVRQTEIWRLLQLQLINCSSYSHVNLLISDEVSINLHAVIRTVFQGNGYTNIYIYIYHAYTKPMDFSSNNQHAVIWIMFQATVVKAAAVANSRERDFIIGTP